MSDTAKDEINYSLTLADDSYAWYRKAAIKSRRSYKASETAILVISTMIPAAAVVFPGNSVCPHYWALSSCW